MKQIYFDHAATTPIHPEVVDEMIEVLQTVPGNPSSVHSFGRKARQLLDEARRTMAKSIYAKEKEITFTSGGTEADNLAIIGGALANQDKGNHIITTKVEHHAALHAVNFLEKRGFNVTYLDVNEEGLVSIDDVRTALRDDTILVSIMYVNNETGVIQPISEIGDLLKDHQALFHTDAVQAYGQFELNVDELSVDLLAVSGHKVNGPKGIGFLYVKEGTRIQSLHHGGEQERKRRAGTENTAAIKGFKKAVELLSKHRDETKEKYQNFKTIFIGVLEKENISFQLNGSQDHVVPSILNVSFPGSQVEALLTNFDLSGIAASSGSACTAGSVEPSHVLSAMYGAEDERGKNSIRFSFGMANTKENVEEGASMVVKIVKRLTSK